jgi:hypothetical protein
MIKFFRKIRQKMLNNGQFGKYLLYAIGEIILVVIGILIALQINNWNGERKDRVTEKKLLLELRENLEINLTHLQEDILKEHISIAAINLVVDHIDNRKPYNDSMDVHFRKAFFSPDIVLSNSAFESIKSKGIEIIHSDSLRKDIVDLIDVTYANLISETVRLENQFWPSSVLPILHTHFRWTGDDTIKPTNYEALLDDQKYINMITNRRHFRELAVKVKGESLIRTESLISHIDNYLN